MKTATRKAKPIKRKNILPSQTSSKSAGSKPARARVAAGVKPIRSDISKRRATEDQVQRLEQRFRALIENSPDGITLLDAHGKVIYDSPAAPGMFGYGPEDWLGKDVFQLLHPDDLPKNQQLLQQLAKTPGGRADNVFRVKHKDGSWIWIEATAKNLLDEPNVNAIVVNYRDITKRTAVEGALRESEGAFHGFLEQSEDAIMLTDEQGAVTHWSKGAERITGYSRGGIDR